MNNENTSILFEKGRFQRIKTSKIFWEQPPKSSVFSLFTTSFPLHLSQAAIPHLLLDFFNSNFLYILIIRRKCSYILVSVYSLSILIPVLTELFLASPVLIHAHFFRLNSATLGVMILRDASRQVVGHAQPFVVQS